MPFRATFEATARLLAMRQHGVVSRRQLLEAGVSPDVIDHRLQCGLVQRLHRGVYFVGAVDPSPEARHLAACMACGAHAVLSHRSAAVTWRIRTRAWRGPIEITLVRGVRRRKGLRTYRLGTLVADEITRHRGIPITSPARTVLDLAAVSPTHRVEQAAAEAIALRLVSLADLEAMALRHAGERGAGRLRAALGTGSGPPRTRSVAEDRFLRLTRRGDVPAPEVNAVVMGYEVDFYWREEGVVVEIDGLTYHRSPRAGERDRRRDAILATRGVTVSRVTWRQLKEEPEAVLVRLAFLLAIGRGRANARPDGNGPATADR